MNIVQWAWKSYGFNAVKSCMGICCEGIAISRWQMKSYFNDWGYQRQREGLLLLRF